MPKNCKTQTHSGNHNQVVSFAATCAFIRSLFLPYTLGGSFWYGGWVWALASDNAALRNRKWIRSQLVDEQSQPPGNRSWVETLKQCTMASLSDWLLCCNSVADPKGLLKYGSSVLSKVLHWIPIMFLVTRFYAKDTGCNSHLSAREDIRYGPCGDEIEMTSISDMIIDILWRIVGLNLT